MNSCGLPRFYITSVASKRVSCRRKGGSWPRYAMTTKLLVARVLFSGVLDGLMPAELAALLSCLSEESREGEVRYSWSLLKQHRDLQKRLQSMGRLAQELHEVQRAHQVTLPVSVQVGYLAASYRWASGEEDWAGLVRDAYGGHEGDLIRAFRRLIDLCRPARREPGG